MNRSGGGSCFLKGGLRQPWPSIRQGHKIVGIWDLCWDSARPLKCGRDVSRSTCHWSWSASRIQFLQVKLQKKKLSQVSLLVALPPTPTRSKEWWGRHNLPSKDKEVGLSDHQTPCFVETPHRFVALPSASLHMEATPWALEAQNWATLLISGEKKTNKHKQIRGIVPEMGGVRA